MNKYILNYGKCQCYKPKQHFKAILQPQEVPSGL
jgi:hypothetical protein